MKKRCTPRKSGLTTTKHKQEETKQRLWPPSPSDTQYSDETEDDDETRYSRVRKVHVVGDSDSVYTNGQTDQEQVSILNYFGTWGGEGAGA